MIKLKNVEYKNKNHHFLFNFAIDNNEFVLISGKNGEGKSTLFHLITGNYLPTSGEIIVNHQLVNKNNKHLPISFLFQEQNFFTHLTIKQNLMLFNEKKSPSLLENITNKLHLNQILNQFPENLSGGQLQRAAFAKLYLQNRSIFLLDEPFSAIDKQTRLFLIQELITFNKNENKTILLISHNSDELLHATNRILTIKDHKISV